jgi:hypothetical protein
VIGGSFTITGSLSEPFFELQLKRKKENAARIEKKNFIIVFF